jgi:hypothetical protein
METLNRKLAEIGQRIGAGLAQALRDGKQQPSEPKSPPSITSLDQLGSIWKTEAQMRWLVPDLLAERSVNLLSAESGTGKTWLAYFLAGRVAHGGKVLGKQAEQRKVLYLDGENPVYMVKQRLHDLGIPETPNLVVWGGWHLDPAPGPDNLLIQEFARKEKPLLIWDSLVEFHTGDEQSSTETRRFMRKFRQLANIGATVLILHHMGKSDSSQEYRGSSDIKAVVDTAFKLKPVGKDQTRLDRLTLEPFKCRLAPLKPQGLKYIQGEGFVETEYVAPNDTKPDALEVVRAIVEANPGLNQADIVERAKEEGIAKHKVEDGLKNTEVFTCTKGQGNARLYTLADSIEEVVPGRAA